MFLVGGYAVISLILKVYDETEIQKSHIKNHYYVARILDPYD